MRKHFLILMLMALLPLTAWSTARDTNGPADGTAVGATITINTSAGTKTGLVTYRVSGWDTTNDFYEVTITGLDADGLDALAAGGDIELEVPLSFEEKFGEQRYKYAVTAIADGLNGATPQAFYGYTQITSLKFVNDRSDKVDTGKFFYTVGTAAGQGLSFYGCTNLETLEFTENCTFIAEYSFQNTAIKEFEIPKQCAAIEAYAFYNCQNLKDVTVASGNTAFKKLDDYVFANSALKNLDLTNATKLETIGTTGKSPFWYNLSVVNDVLKTVTLPASVVDINDSFSWCTALTNIFNLQNTDLVHATTGTHIIDKAFQGDRSLTRLDLPSCDIIGSPFIGCAALDTLTFKSGYNCEIGKTLAAGSNLYGVYTPGVAGYSANDQKALKVIEFNGVLNGDIDDKTFVGMTALAKVDFKGKLQSDTKIGAAFTDVTSLKEVVFNGINNDGVANVEIAADAFRNTGITALNFNTVEMTGGSNRDFKIAANAFSDCADLATITFGDITVSNTGKFEIYGTAFTNNPKLTTVTFGETTYTKAGTIDIKDNAFAAGNVLLSEVEFGNISANNASTFTIGTVGTGAPVFGDGARLATVTFGNIAATAFTIGNNAFKSTGLTNVTFGNLAAATNANSNITIDKSAFEGGDAADKTVTIGTIKDGTTGALTLAINQDAFAAKMLKSVNIAMKADGTADEIAATSVTIDETAFANANKVDCATNNETKLSTQNLQEVNIGNITAGVAASTFTVNAAAFWGGKAADKTVTIGTIKDGNAATKTMTVTINQDAFVAEKLKSVKIGDMVATAITVDENAFANTKKGVPAPAAQNLQSVVLGNITAPANNNATLEFKAAAFWGGTVNDKVVTIGTIKDNTKTDKTTSLTIGDDAFAAQSLKTVTIAADGMAATNIKFGENAFANATKAELASTVPATQNLQTVTLGNITTGDAGTSTLPAIYNFEAKKGAFWGGNVAAKTVKIGTITNGDDNNTLTAIFGDQVAEADQLTNVEIKDMTAKSVAIGKSAFSGKQLVKVDLGAMTAATLTVDDQAFANTNTTDVLTENVTIGELKTADFTSTNAKAFQGPQADGSALNVSIAKISGAVTIPANTFVAPAKGTASYIIKGDVGAGTATNIAAFAFIGAKDAADATKNATSVKIQGDYNASLTSRTFTNVEDAEIAVGINATTNKAEAKNIAVSANYGAFAGTRLFTFGNVPAGKNVTGNSSYLTRVEELTFLGNVLGTISNFSTAKKIRKIDFANVGTAGVTVAANAIAAQAFEAAADDALTTGENISIIYQEKQTREAVNIFDAEAFVAPAATTDEPVATVYTTEWAKANVYESTEPTINHKVYRLTFSASDVVPGEEINVTVGKRDADTYAYGKLYLPKGSKMKYKVNAEVTGTGTDAVNNVQLYYARIDKSKNAIYMHSLPTIDGYYWIDATEVDHAFMVRTKGKESGTVITAEPVTEAEDALFAADVTGDYVYFDKSFAKMNQFGYTTQKIANQNLRNDAEFLDRDIFYLANPKTRGFAFIQVDKTQDGLAAKSLYIVGKLNTVNGRANVIFDDEVESESETTGIENVEVESNNDAIYNLQGVRVNGATKGLFIQNGKKYVVK